jgi:hypothetical protein
MPDDEALRRARRQKMALRRLAEPGIERGGDEVDRGGDEVDRGGDEVDRGGDEVDRGRRLFASGPSRVAADIFERAINLGGHLIVAFVAPVSAPSRSRRRPGSGFSSPQAVAAAADAELAELRLVLTRKRMQLAHASQTRMADDAAAGTTAGPHEPWSATTKE